MMTRLTDSELEALLSEPESDRTERKEAWSGGAPAKVREAVCAFANDLPNHRQPGVIFIGAGDDGVPSGLCIDDQLLLTLSDIKTDGKIVPPPTLTVEKRHLNGTDLAVICVWPADAPPVRFDGRIWIRIGPRRGLASAQDERILNEKRRHLDIHFEAHPLRTVPLTELSRPLFELEYLPGAVAPDVLAANERSYEQRLASCGMIASIEEPFPTVLGLLCLGKTPRTWIPGHYIQFLRVRGTEWSGPVADADEMDGPIGTILRRLDDKLRAHMTTAVDFTSQTVEVRKSPYPMVALQQISRNAVMHRSYEGTNAPVRVYWFDDRIEIISPGGPFGSVNAANFGQPGQSDYRNPGLASAMKNLGFVQRFGFGIGEAQRALKANGNPPLEFDVQPALIKAIMRAAH